MPRLLLSAFVWAMLALASSASAQTDIEINAGLQLNFSQPGARSLGMGSAFIGLADDATAAYTNPAGLAHISTGEVFVEGRQWDFTATFTEGGTATVGNGTLDGSGLIEGAAESSTEGESFYSFTWPFGRWVVGLYQHQLANYEAAFQTRGVDIDGSLGPILVLPVKASTRLQIEGTGVAAAVKLGNDLSLGFGVASYDFFWESTTRRFLSVAARDRDSWINGQDIVGDDDAIAASVGLEWKINDRWHLGGVFRQGPEFDFTTTNQFGPATIFFDGDIVDQDERTFRVPDIVGVGIAYTAPRFRVLFDWVRVGYSKLAEDTVSAFTDEPESDLAASRLTLDDADELHLGFEYIFSAGANPIAVRLGAWLDPDHEIRYEGPIDSVPASGRATRFRAGSDEIHTTAGFGIALAGGRMELNVAADFSERVDTASASLLFRIF